MSSDVQEQHGTAKSASGGCCSCGEQSEGASTAPTEDVFTTDKEGNQRRIVTEGDSDTETELDRSPGPRPDLENVSEEAWTSNLLPDADVDNDTAMSGLGEEQQLEPIEVDDEAEVDLLSIYPSRAFDAVTSNSSTRSIYPGDIDYVDENGRRYVGDFSMPNDEDEQFRMFLLHQVYLHLFDHQLTTVELDNPTLILDIGTGTGFWAIAIAMEYPKCDVIGTDLSDIQDTNMPHNLEFEVDDCHIEWDRPPTDLVHLRNMSGLIDDWSFIYNQAYTCLKPGGYIELLDFLAPGEAADTWLEHFAADSPIHQLMEGVQEVARLTGRQFDADHLSTEMLSAAGFVEIEIDDDRVQLDPDEPVGKWWTGVCLLWTEAAYLRLLTRVLGWDPKETKELIKAVNDEVQRIMTDPATQDDFAVKFRRAKARKPLDAPWPMPHSAVASVYDVTSGVQNDVDSADVRAG